MDNDAQGLDSARDGLRFALGSLRRAWPVVLAVSLAVGIGVFTYDKLQQPEYRATATLYVTSGIDDNSNSAYTGGQAAQQRVSSYTRLVSSDAVLDGALVSIDNRLSRDVAKSALTSSSPADSVLLNVSATLANRRLATDLANAVANSVTEYVAKLETPAGGGRPLAKVTVITPAVSSSAPVSPRIRRDSVLAIVLGLVLGSAIVVLWARFNNRIREERDLSLVFDAPVLAGVPSEDVLKGTGLLDFSRGGTGAAEAFRKLRTNLGFANVDMPPRVLLVSSAGAMEGKTTTAMNLAAALVEAGSRVILVDGDLRRPQVGLRSGVVGQVGFTNYLRSDASLGDFVQPTDLDGLWILASGPKPPNPAELLGTKRAGQVLSELSASFDYVIVDSPPILAVTDAVVLAQWVEGVLLVARSGSTRVDDLVDAVEQIVASRTSIVGFVLTEAPTHKSRYSYYTVKPKRRFPVIGRKREPKAMEQVLEPQDQLKN